MVHTKTTYDLYENGDLTGDEALAQLADQYAGIEDSLEPLEEQRKIIRNQMSIIVDRQGGKVTLDGFGTMQITAPSITASYDSRQLDALVVKLTHEYPDIARAIAACRKETSRAGSLMIRRAKP